MRKGYVSPFQQGHLSGISDVLTLIAKRAGQRAINSDAIFYTSAFQAGIDEFLVANIYRDPSTPLTTSSTFIASRTTAWACTCLGRILLFQALP
jgi:hypothetical protein